MDTTKKDTFDIQLFADEETGNPIPIDGEDYTIDVIKTALADSKNRGEWQKTNTDRAEENAREKRKIEQLQKEIGQQQEQLQPFIDLSQIYYTDPDVRKDWEQMVNKYNKKMKGESIVDDDSDAFVDPKIKFLETELSQLKNMLAEKDRVEMQHLRQEDYNRVNTAIETNKDPFTMDEVTKLAASEVIRYGDAYQKLKGMNIDKYRETIRAEEKEKLLEEIKEKTPTIPIVKSGGGIVTKEIPWEGWMKAPGMAAKSHPIPGFE